jgi:hypothetical protein
MRTMFRYGFIMLGLLCLNTSSLADTTEFQCVVKISKASCWKPFNVNIYSVNLLTLKKIETFALPKGTMFIQKIIPCDEFNNARFLAQYSPAIWKEDNKTYYKAKRIWQPPYSVPDGTKYWVTKVCFPSDFQSVPIPLDGVRNCKCEFPDKPLPGENGASESNPSSNSNNPSNSNNTTQNRDR